MITRRAYLREVGIGGLAAMMLGPAAGSIAADTAAERPGLADLPIGEWTALPATTPSPRAGGDLRWVYDQRARVTIMVGGDNVCKTIYCRTTWAYDVASNRWDLKIPDDAPKGSFAGRCQPALAYDPVRDRTWMYGGLTSRNVQKQREEGYGWGELWEYSNADNRWTNHDVAVEDQGRPHFRRMFFDPHQDRLFLLGPVRGNSALAGWSYKPGDTAWKKMPLTGELPRGWRWGGGYLPMALDTKRRRFVMLDSGGGRDSRFSRTLVFEAGTGRFREISGDGPSYRAYHDLVYDVVADRIVLYGGNGDDRSLGDTWLFDPEAERWTELKPSASPGPRQQFALAYDASNNVTVLYGGSRREGEVESKPYRAWVLRLARGEAR